MKPMTIILIGAVIAVLGGIISAIGTFMHNKNSSEKTTRIEEGVKTTNTEVSQLKGQNEHLLTQTITLNEKLENQSTTIDGLRKENTALYDKLAKASLNIFDHLTGGNSYCKMEIGNINISNDEGGLVFWVEGKDPLSQIHARIVDLNDPHRFDLQQLNKNVVDIGTMTPAKAYVTQISIKLDKVNGVNLNIFFSANNGFTTQLTRMKFSNDKWLRATKIVKGFTGEELFLEIDPDYPIKDKDVIFK